MHASMQARPLLPNCRPQSRPMSRLARGTGTKSWKRQAGVPSTKTEEVYLPGGEEPCPYNAVSTRRSAGCIPLDSPTSTSPSCAEREGAPSNDVLAGSSSPHGETNSNSFLKDVSSMSTKPWSCVATLAAARWAPGLLTGCSALFL